MYNSKHISEEPEGAPGGRLLSEFSLPSMPGNERQAMEQVADVVKTALSLSSSRLERLKTAVAEATMNAMEHGNHFQPDLPVDIKIDLLPTELVVSISDHSGGVAIPEQAAPDLEAKLAGYQSPRGWGLFLIRNMVDEMRITTDSIHHTVQLVLHLRGDQDDQSAISG